ncbi:MAG: autotransporter translocation and assembly factor TamB [Arenicella sp.]|jgi:autotransporter translocation and assembly factor TamB
MMTIVSRVLWSFAILISLCTLFAGWLLGTQSGLHWAVNLAPDILQVKAIEGDVSDLRFKQLQFNSGATTLRISSGSLQWSPLGLFGKRALVNILNLNGVALELPQPTPSTERFEPWQGIDLPIDVVINRASVTQLSVRQLTQPGLLTQAHIDLSGALVNNILDLEKLTLTESKNVVSIQGEVDLSARSIGVVDLTHSLTYQFDDSTLVSQGTIAGTWASLKLEQQLTSPFSASLSASFDDALTERIAWNSVLRTEELKQQAVLGEILSLGSGQLNLDGEFLPSQGLAGLSTRLVGQVSAGNPQLSQWQVDADISFRNNNLRIDKLRLGQIGDGQPGGLVIEGHIDNVVRFLDQADDSGSVDIKGNWSSLTWPLDANSSANSKANSSLSNLAGRFTLTGSSLNYEVLASSSGQSQGKPLNAEVDVLLAGRTVDLRELTLTLGSSVVRAKGKIGERINLTLNFEFPDIGDFLVGAKGPLSSSGKLSGDRATPTIKMQAASSGLSFSGYSANQIGLSANVSLSDSNQVMDIKLQANSVKQNQTSVVDSFDLAVNGRVQAHTVVINSTLANQATLNARARGGLIENQWKGQLSTLSLDDPLISVWALQKEVALQIAENTFSISRSCMINQAQSFCFEANKTVSELALEAELNAIDLANVNPLFQLYDLDIAGQANGRFSYIKQVKELAGKIDGYLESNSPIVTWQETGDEELSDEALILETVRLDIEQDQTLWGAINIRLLNSDKLNAEFAINAPVESPDFVRAVSQGKANVRIADLSILPTVLLDAVSLNGELNADIQLAGTLAVPKINALAAVTNARVDIPELGLQFEDLALKVDSDGTSKIRLNGQLRSGSGSLKLSGNVDFTNLKAPEISLILNGDDLQLANTPELNIIGDLDLTAKFTNQLFDLRGGVVIDKAMLDFKIPETALVVSKDVILKGAEKQEERSQQILRLTVDLGKQAHIRAQGVDADISGKLLVFQESGGILRGDGQITVNNGRYRAYGQDLKIDQGGLLFSGGSIEDPSLDLKAEKKVELITAGVGVTGRASSPKLNLYSTPSMQDEDILSVLIFDKPLGKLGSQDGLTLLRIANSLRGDGTSEVTKMTEKLQQALGLTNLELQITDNAPSIVAGKQLSSKFYVGYGYGLLDAAQSLILRYKLSKAWSIKADLGADSGADLRYQLER